MSNFASSSQSSPTLRKGAACLNCRRRKIRCDGDKPRCGPCSTSEMFHDCEYATGGTSRAQLLEEQVALLEARIKELEHPPEANSPSTVFLAQPYESNEDEPSTENDLELTVPVELHTEILRAFLQHHWFFGFFLNTGRFAQAALTPNPRISPALLNAALLCGIHVLASSPSAAHLQKYESGYLSRALSHARQALTARDRTGILHCIQAEVLLAVYFFRRGKIIEGKYHTNAATSIVFSVRLHKIRSAEEEGGPSSFEDLATTSLDPPSDMVDEGEGINAFWAVVTLNCSWTAEECGSFYDIVDTPWPLDMQQYSQIFRSPDFRSHKTIQKFLDNTPLEEGDYDSSVDRSVFAQVCKSMVLYEGAVKIGGRFRADLSPSERRHFFSSFVHQETNIRSFSQVLIPIQVARETVGDATTVLVHTLHHAAMMQLHMPVVDVNPNSRAELLSSARSVVGIMRTVNIFRLKFIDAFFGTILSLLCRVLILEVWKGRSSGDFATEPMDLLHYAMQAFKSISAQNKYFELMYTDVAVLFSELAGRS